MVLDNFFSVTIPIMVWNFSVFWSLHFIQWNLRSIRHSYCFIWFEGLFLPLILYMNIFASSIKCFSILFSPSWFTTTSLEVLFSTDFAYSATLIYVIHCSSYSLLGAFLLLQFYLLRSIPFLFFQNVFLQLYLRWNVPPICAPAWITKENGGAQPQKWPVPIPSTQNFGKGR